MNILVDMNLSPRWTGLLKDSGFEALHWSAVGRANAPDPEIMAYAAAHNYVVLTHDLDFSAILAATQGAKPSVVQIRSGDLSPAAVGRNVVLALRRMEIELQAGALLSIDPKGTRVRLLPLGSRQ
jgi:predicted nuclease of predicted toxin-antitoxin system